MDLSQKSQAARAFAVVPSLCAWRHAQDWLRKEESSEIKQFSEQGWYKEGKSLERRREETYEWFVPTGHVPAQILEGGWGREQRLEHRPFGGATSAGGRGARLCGKSSRSHGSAD
ncbi:MAG: hypothetical protein A3H28_00065 [Acidobacteria bacterium RIFCSPLOWO2_02_FULL_61_28]|nr:MAG: hypothetical protein A3H28_00065 [Acidobacteria bacterium RIFCSPLOWO2_02_FULL_61_28]